MPEVSTWGAIASIIWGVWIAAMLEYFHVSGEAVVILSVMLMLDFVFWIADAYIEDKYKVTSKQMRRGLVRKVSRWLLPFIVIAVLRWAWIWELEIVSTTIFSILIVTEGYSIIGHIYSINSDSHEKLPEIDCFEMLLSFIIWLFKKKIPNLEEKLDDKE